MSAALRAHFGGPGRPDGALRDLLAERVDAVPEGGAIDWVTYYFRDRRLADALVAARRRGVDVRITLEGRPRTVRANRAVIERLRAGLGAGLRVVASPADRWPRAKLWRARVHEKLYAFSHPAPVALIGSFNPSGDVPEEEPDVVREIGDQDRGSNLLVEIGEVAVVAGLVAHARRLHAGHHGVIGRLAPAANRVLHGDALDVRFTPGLRRAPALALLRPLGRGARLRVAASHLSGELAAAAFARLAARGASLSVVADHTARRIPPDVEARLRAAGIEVRRATRPEGLPMHDKFVLVEGAGPPWALFGSFNWTRPSLCDNREIVAVSRDPGLLDALEARWTELSARCEPPPGGAPARVRAESRTAER